MKIKIEIVSRKHGHQDQICHSILEAKQVIKKETEDGKWLYVDGKLFQPGNITDQDIAQAEQIRLVAELVGGR